MKASDAKEDESSETDNKEESGRGTTGAEKCVRTLDGHVEISPSTAKGAKGHFEDSQRFNGEICGR